MLGGIHRSNSRPAFLLLHMLPLLLWGIRRVAKWAHWVHLNITFQEELKLLESQGNTKSWIFSRFKSLSIALKDTTPNIKQPSAVTNSGKEHLYEHIPESEEDYSTEKYRTDNTAMTRPPLPPKSPKSKLHDQHTQVVRNEVSKPGPGTLTKPKKSLGEWWSPIFMCILNDECVYSICQKHCWETAAQC